MWMRVLGRMWLGWFHRCQLIAVYPGLTVNCLVLPEAFYRLGTEKLELLCLLAWKAWGQAFELYPCGEK